MGLRSLLAPKRKILAFNLLFGSFFISNNLGSRCFCSAFIREIESTAKSSFSLRPSGKHISMISESVDPVAELGLPSPIMLGSGSFTRKLILKEMNVKFELLVMPIDEKGIGDRSDGANASELVTLLAKAKGDHIVQSFLNESEKYANLKGKEFIVLTGDQVVVQGTKILEKPTDINEAKQFVRSYGDCSPRTVGACALTHVPSLTQVIGFDTAQINFKESISEDGDKLIDRLLEDSAPVLSCAGGLMVEHPFVREFIESIDGTEDSVMGLSKDLVLKLLKDLKEKLKLP